MREQAVVPHTGEQAVVLTSGGQDSTTCLAWAISAYGRDNILPVTFNYGQRHVIEVQCARDISEYFGVPDPYLIDVPILREFGAAALTNPDIEVEAETSPESMNAFAHSHGLPSTFIPGRNMLFLTLAAAYGAQRGVYNLITGVCEADASGYPDCRAEFIDAARVALSAALADDVQIYTPLIAINKAATWQLADDLGILKVIVEMTHTCYNGVHDEKHFHEWGYGCDNCPACAERRKGYEEFRGAVSA